MSMVRDSLRYGHAVGRVRVRETRLLSRSHFERLLDAATFSDQLRILSDTPYGGHFDGVSSIEGLQAAMDRVRLQLHDDLLGRSGLPEPITRFFALLDGYQEARNGTAENPAEWAADIALYKEIVATAEASGCASLRELAALLADVANLKVLVRSKARGEAGSWDPEMFVPAGAITQERLVALHRLPAEEVAAQLAALDLLKGIDPQQILDPARFDVVADVVVASRMRESSALVAAGAGPVITYVVLQRIEMIVVRTLLAGVMAGVSRDLLRTRFREIFR